jgi:hypothetical protein
MIPVLIVKRTIVGLKKEGRGKYPFATPTYNSVKRSAAAKIRAIKNLSKGLGAINGSVNLIHGPTESQQAEDHHKYRIFKIKPLIYFVTDPTAYPNGSE